ncbi:hypothetical protein AVEN_117201-1 [Araneus ventricosus]|uniref:Uncharacterized protein n=1 Tax=Araneus ventricosus TaxID=182803 RepID=A0A4Y2AX67_ARAVE|nr:hypothetical protein AVEN_117201-1 [Araneus ventricosus]
MFVPASLPNGCDNFDDTWHSGSLLTNLKYRRGKLALTQCLRVGWGKIPKLHITNRLVDMPHDFDETRYTDSSLADLKYCRRKYGLTQSLWVARCKISEIHILQIVRLTRLPI